MKNLSKQSMINKSALWLLFCLLCAPGLQAFEINDGHIHYNEDIWSRFSPEQAIRSLSRNNIKRAVVSSTPAEGTEKLYALAPDRVIPFLRPYRVHRDRFTYHSDQTIVTYLQQKIATGIYKGIGEFHLFEEHKDTDVVQQIMQLAANNDLAISAHSDHATILTLVNLQPDVRVIWAHCGMDHPVADVVQALQQYPNLFCELSFRYGMLDEDGRLVPEWRSLLENNPTRFVLGMDTYIPKRWAELPENVETARNWLMQLSPDARDMIARENINDWFPRL
ncbi:MAG: amidohydrolase family protein [Chromatiales bacterium]